MRSDPIYGSIWFRHHVNIATGQEMPNRYSGRDISLDFINAIHPKGKKLPAGFNAELYLQANPDVRSAGMVADEHWLRYGRHEGRRIEPA